MWSFPCLSTRTYLGTYLHSSSYCIRFLHSSVELKRDSDLRISVRNPLSGDEVRENVIVNPTETVEQEDGAREPPFHFTLKWEGSKKASILRVLDPAETTSALKKKKKVEPPRSYTGEDVGNWVPLLAMECRGLERK